MGSGEFNRRFDSFCAGISQEYFGGSLEWRGRDYSFRELYPYRVVEIGGFMNELVIRLFNRFNDFWIAMIG